MMLNLPKPNQARKLETAKSVAVRKRRTGIVGNKIESALTMQEEYTLAPKNMKVAHLPGEIQFAIRRGHCVVHSEFDVFEL